MDKSQDERPYGDRHALHRELIRLEAAGQLRLVAMATDIPEETLRKAIENGPANLTQEQAELLGAPRSARMASRHIKSPATATR